MTNVQGTNLLLRRAAQLLLDRYRCSEDLAQFALTGELSSAFGFFRFGPNVTCYGQCSSSFPAKQVSDPLHDASDHVSINGRTVQLSFDPAQVIDNLRCENYSANSVNGEAAVNILRRIYYFVRPLMPISLRRHFQKLYLLGWSERLFPAWPVDQTVENLFEELLVLAMKASNVRRVPFIWFWPDGAQSCTLLTHDVETRAGVEFCRQLMDLNDSFAIKASFQLVPEKRYSVPQHLLDSIRQRGFEVNIHDLNHDGHLFSNREEFLRRAKRINSYVRQFGALGFRSAVMFRNVNWYNALDISYDMSVPNVAHLDPQHGGCCTVMPFFVGNIVELPVTTTQDYTLFHILNDYSIQLWKEQISLIRKKHGLISFIIHPDYIIDEAPRSVYAKLLAHLCEMRSNRQTWITLPKEVAAWWRLRSELSIVHVAGSWRIVGEGHERARLAYAVLHNDHISYEVDGD